MHTESVMLEARSVVQIAVHFDELKGRATALSAAAEAQDRGYFTPDEDMETKNILASYWSARNALLDFICSYRDESFSNQNSELKEQAFLTAFASALVLVDAARFLRETFHERPLVRSKLNESAPTFAIPEGCYDQIQRSLFSARHAWHLFHAIRYFQKNEKSLRESTAGTPFDDLWPIVDPLEHRMDVPLSSYARARLRARSGMVTRRLTLGLLQKSMYGLQKLAGILLAEKYVRLGHEPSLPSKIRQGLAQILRPGDLLVVRKEFAITNYFLPGYWPHAALYLGTAGGLEKLGLPDMQCSQVENAWSRISATRHDERPLEVLESMKDGVHLRSLDSPYRCDSVVVLRFSCQQVEVAEALSRALRHDGKPYDFSFDFRRADQLVCTEVAYRGYEGVGGIEFPLVQRAGRPTLSGSDLVKLAIEGSLVQPAAIFAPRLGGKSANIIVDPEECRALMRLAEGDSA